MRFKMLTTHSDRKAMRRSDLQAGRATTFVLVGVAVVAVAGLVFAFMKVTSPDSTQLASVRPGDASRRTGTGLAGGSGGGGSGQSGGGGSMGSEGSGTNADRNVVGGRSGAFSTDATGGGSVFGPDGRLLHERQSADDGTLDREKKPEGKGGIGGTGYGTSAGGKSVLGNYAPPPPKPLEDVSPEARSPGETRLGVEPAPNLGLPPDTLIVGVGTDLTHVKILTTKRQIAQELNRLASLDNPPTVITLPTFNPNPGGGRGMISMSLNDAMDMVRAK